MGSFLAWRWARVGGIAVALGGIVLSCVAYFTAPIVVLAVNTHPPKDQVSKSG